MTLHIFSNLKTIKELFAPLSKDHKIVFYKPNSILETAKEIPPCEFIYLDIQSISTANRTALLLDLINLKIHQYGIIDYKGEIIEIAYLFHLGYIDYISKAECKLGIKNERFKYIKKYQVCTHSENETDSTSRSFTLKEAEKGWGSIREGEEYSFFILYMRIEHLYSLKSHFGYKFSDSLVTNYFDYLKKYFSPIEGKLWLVDDNKGLFLFPNTSDHLKVILSIYRIILNKIILSGEVLKSPNIINTTFILHLGNIVYLNQELAGRSVSDSLNFIFHAASNLASPGNFYITDTLFKYIPEPIKNLFKDSDSFEGRDFKVMQKQLL